MKFRKIFFIVLLIISIDIICPSFILAQEEQEVESAEINAFVKGEIPPVKTSQWTQINITIEDRTGLNWTLFKKLFFNDSTPIKLVINFINRVWWNIQFPFPVNRYLGYFSIRLKPEIIEGNPEGWFLRVRPNTLSPTTTGFIHQITLEARIEDSLVDYAVTIGINCTRYDTFGDLMGISYIYIPVRASPVNNLKLNVADTTKKAGLNSVATFHMNALNKGNYRDVFQFDVEEENDVIGVIDTQVLTLDPGEKQNIILSVITNDKLIDFGTANKLNIYAYSDSDPNKVLVGSFVVFTQGITITQEVIILIISIATIFSAIFVFFYIKSRRDIYVRGKPERPWRITVEREYLKMLKRDGRRKYNDVRMMMKNEYRSALMWFTSYSKNLKQKKRRKYTLANKRKSKSVEKAVKEYNVNNSVQKSKDQISKEEVVKRILKEQRKQKRKINV